MMGVSRFDDLQSRLQISRNTLTERINRLVETGIVEKHAYQQHPPRFDYRLTEKGTDLWLVITTMREWGDRWTAPDGPPVELMHVPCGQVTRVVPTCSTCGEVLRRRDLRLIDGPGAGANSLLPVNAPAQSDQSAGKKQGSADEAARSVPVGPR